MLSISKEKVFYVPITEKYVKISKKDFHVETEVVDKGRRNVEEAGVFFKI